MASCAQHRELQKARDTVIPEVLYPKVVRQEGSIWPGETPKNIMFTDAKARFVGDVITVVVSETAESSQSATTNTQKTTSLDLQTGRLLGLPSNLGIANFLGSNNGFSPNIDAQTSRSNNGQGTTTRNGTLTATISCIVTDVLPNGNMHIEGKRVVTVNAEDQIMILKGIVRPVDVNFDNTVNSSQVANAEITLVGRGVVADEQRVGWATRILSWVWPF